MNKMFRLPVCPHCGTIYRYRDVWNAVRQSKKPRKDDNHCYHCEKKFNLSFKGLWLWLMLWLLLSIGMNLLLLSQMTRLDLFVMFAATLGLMALAVALIPYFVAFKAAEEQTKKK